MKIDALFGKEIDILVDSDLAQLTIGRTSVTLSTEGILALIEILNTCLDTTLMEPMELT